MNNKQVLLTTAFALLVSVSHLEAARGNEEFTTSGTLVDHGLGGVNIFIGNVTNTWSFKDAVITAGVGNDARVFIGANGGDPDGLTTLVLTAPQGYTGTFDLMPAEDSNEDEIVLGQSHSGNNYFGALTIDGGVTLKAGKVRARKGPGTVNLINGILETNYGVTKTDQFINIDIILGGQGTLIVPVAVTNMAEYDAWAHSGASLTSAGGVDIKFDTESQAGKTVITAPIPPKGTVIMIQ